MKYLAIAFALSLAGCVTDEYGNTRFDVDTATRAVDAGFNAYDRYYRHPQPHQPAYVAPYYAP